MGATKRGAKNGCNEIVRGGKRARRTHTHTLPALYWKKKADEGRRAVMNVKYVVSSRGTTRQRSPCQYGLDRQRVFAKHIVSSTLCPPLLIVTKVGWWA